jgi:hypothetical protein
MGMQPGRPRDRQLTMYGTIFEKLQALLSRNYWLGNFFPIFVIALLNLALAWAGIDGFSAWLAVKWPDAMVLSAVPALGLVTVGILAFVLAPLIPVFRKALEGEFLPRSLRDVLTAEFVTAARALDQQVQDAKATLAAFEFVNRQAPTRLTEAHDAAGPRNDLTRATFNAARTATDNLEAQIQARRTARTYRERLPDQATVNDAIDRLAAALRQYPMDLNVKTARDIADSLDKMLGRLSSTLQIIKGIANRNLQEAQANLRSAYVMVDIRPTRLANARAAIEQYPSVAYEADFDFLGPRLNLVLGKSQATADAVASASSQLDFAVLMTVLTALTAVWWLIAIPVFGSSIVLYFIVGIGLPALALFFYQLVGETQRAFGAVMEMAVDGLHLDLLAALHQPLPATLQDEQQTWHRLQVGLYSGLGTGVRYRHPKP